MEFQKQNTLGQDFLDCGSVAPCCPLLKIPRIDEQGMVMEMRCGFEVGSTIALGFHLQDGAGKQLVSRFISLEVMVIESKIGSGSGGQPVHLVTVLFSLISCQAREELLRFAGSHTRSSKPKTSAQGPLSSTMKTCNERFLRQVTQCIGLN